MPYFGVYNSTKYALESLSDAPGRRAAARYIAPRRTSLAIWMSAILPTAVWDWAMRKAGFLTASTLDLSVPSNGVPVPVPQPQAKPAAEAHASAN